MIDQLTDATIKGLCGRGVSMAQAAAMIGRGLTDEERTLFRKYAGILKTKGPVKRETGAASSADRVKALRERQRALDCQPCADPARRKRLERDPVKWLRWYMETAFTFPFSDGHLLLIERVIHAAKTGEGTATAQPRGEGKSTILTGVLIYLVVTGVLRFPVLVGWKHDDAKKALASWLRMLCDNERFAADYPEICTPFRHSTHATALKNLTWKHNGKPIGAMVDNMSKVVTLPGSMGAIAARSAQGDSKGLSAMMPDGTVLRPDFLAIDDAQDPKQADNASAVAKTIDNLENVFLGMGGRQKRLAAAAACTVEREGDVSCHFLTRNGWTATLVSRIQTWPDGSQGGTWEREQGCPIRALWDEWRGIYLGDGQQKANAFFRKNRKHMVGKMEVSWIHGYDHDKEVSAYDAAMHMWYTLGPDVFARGQQNKPLKRGVDVYNIMPEVVMSRAVDRAPYVVPERTEVITVGTDINPSYALTSCVIGFDRDASADYLYYGRHTDAPLPCTPTMSETQRQAAIFDALTRLGMQLLAMPCKPKGWMIDGGGAQSAVAKKFRYEWNRRHPELPVTIGYGRSGKSARISARNETIRARGDNWILCRQKDKDYGSEEWVLWHADAFREIMQRAWTCEIGSPGGATLPRGQHREFGEEICRERLKAKGMVGDKMVWDFEKGAGKNDFPDAAGMAYAMASILGVNSGGVTRVKQQPRRPRSGVTVIAM